MADMITYAAASGMKAAMMDITTRTNNLANINSLGFKAQEVETKDGFYVKVTKAGIQEAQDLSPRPVGVELGTGSKISGTYRNLEQGSLKQTGRTLDVAIMGSGYFAVTLPNNQRAYTRGGALKLSPTRQLVTTEGYALADDITIPDGIQEHAINITEDGRIVADDNAGGLVEIGQIQVYSFANERGLDQIGSSYYTENIASGEGQANIAGTAGLGKLSQRNLELSNVDVSTEFAGFMAAQQAYELCAKMLKVGDELVKELTK